MVEASGAVKKGFMKKIPHTLAMYPFSILPGTVLPIPFFFFFKQISLFSCWQNYYLVSKGDTVRLSQQSERAAQCLPH